MRRYQFRLSKVLDFWARLEDLLKEEFSEIKSRLDQEQALIDQLIASYRQEVEGLLEKGELTPVELGWHQAYLEQLRTDMAERRRVIEVIKRCSEEKREELIRARKERMILEILKDKDFKDYLQAEARAEQGLIDEYNTNLLHRKRSSQP